MDKKLKIEMLEKMVLIRFFEEKVKEFASKGLIRGSVHLSIGQEAVAVGACYALEENDYIFNTHRGHGHILAKGVDAQKVMEEILGRSTGPCKGRSGSVHLADISKGVLGANGIVGAQLPIATGVALALKYFGEKRIPLCFFGDGANNQGTFHEALNLAAIWQLPVIFLCENNNYAMSFSVAKSTAVSDISTRAASYNIPGKTVDGNDVLAVYEAVQQAEKMAKKDMCPILLECKTYRYEGHWTADPCVYRTEEEVNLWRKRDPIIQLKKTLIEEGILLEKTFQEINERIKKEVDEIAEKSLQSPEPTADSALDYVYA